MPIGIQFCSSFLSSSSSHRPKQRGISRGGGLQKRGCRSFLLPTGEAKKSRGLSHIAWRGVMPKTHTHTHTHTHGKEIKVVLGPRCSALLFQRNECKPPTHSPLSRPHDHREKKSERTSHTFKSKKSIVLQSIGIAVSLNSLSVFHLTKKREDSDRDRPFFPSV